MEPMTELLDEAAVERAILLIGILGPLLGLLAGGLWAKLKQTALLPTVLRGGALGLLGTLVWALWRLYSHLVRFEPAPDPADDYFGLERVDILFVNLGIFVAVGLAVGWTIRWVRDRDLARAAAGELVAESGVAEEA